MTGLATLLTLFVSWYPDTLRLDRCGRFFPSTANKTSGNGRSFDRPNAATMCAYLGFNFAPPGRAPCAAHLYTPLPDS